MENMEKKEVKNKDSNEVRNEIPKKDDRMVICSDGSVMSYQIAKNPRFSEDV